MSTQTESQKAERIKEEVRQVVRRLTELSQTTEDFDKFCSEVLGSLVEITGAHGALFWQITADGIPRLTHHSGRAPHDQARAILKPENDQHNRAILDVVREKNAVCVSSESFTVNTEDVKPPLSKSRSADPLPFLMMFAPVYNRQKDAVGTVELIQRGEVSAQAKEGYLRFLTQIATLFQRWHQRQEVTRPNTATAAQQQVAVANQRRSGNWNQRMEFVSEVHRSIDFKETAYAIANESRRVLSADRVSVGRWNGRKCKILAISSQDRFDNRANVVRKLSKVATASVGADSTFWITGSTDHVAPEVATKINDYLDESHSRTLAVIPLAVRPPDVPDLDMNKRSKRVRKLGAIILEYFDEDITEQEVAEDVNLVVEQSQLALENSRKHGEIFLQPVFKKLGWLQQTLFGDHRKKTLFGLFALTALTLAMIFIPWELKMNVDGILQPEHRRHVYATSKGIIKEVNFEDNEKVTKGQLLLTMVDYDREQSLKRLELERERLTAQALETYARLQEASPEEEIRLEAEYSSQRDQREFTDKMLAAEKAVMGEVLEVRAPIDGRIVTWNPRQRLQDLPVDPNQTLVSISQIEGQWQLEVKIPHIKVGYVEKALEKAREDDDKDSDTIPVRFALSTNPSKTYRGELSRVSIRPFTDESGIQKYRGVVQVEAEDLDLSEMKPGAGATVKIHCGKVPLYRACLYQIIDWCQTNLWLF